jgi:hypothetical protein
MPEDTLDADPVTVHVQPMHHQRRLESSLGVRARPGADHHVEIELTGPWGAIGLDLTAAQASSLASQLSLAAHTIDDA